MVRRPLSSPEGASPQPSGHIKREKINSEPLKQNKKLKSRAARVVDEEEDAAPSAESAGHAQGDNEDAIGDDDDAEGDDDEEEGSPKGRKRARVSEEGDSQSVNGRERDVRATLPRGEDGFIPGSIVRIQLQNFVTYDWVEFRPGPYLNMILGPNGTGKSSIACAICLGLNWPPQILGRANELNLFVKIGAEKGHIEIELKGPKGQKNLVIRRSLSASSRGSSFTLNGHTATGKEINARMAALNVQIGNLCTFLPQDKVSEFAQMTPQELLKQTQLAAGEEHLTNWHETLIKSGKDLKQIQEAMKGENEQLTTMKNRNADLERDVERYNARLKIEREIALLEVLLPVQEYREAFTLYKETKNKQRALHERVKKLKEKNAPAHNLLAELSTKYRSCEKSREDKKKASQQKFKSMSAKWSQAEKLEQEADDITSQLDRLKKEEKDCQKKIKETEAKIAQYENELANPPAIEKQGDLQEDFRRLSADRIKTKEAQDELQDRQRQNVDKSSRQQATIDACEKDLKNLQDENERKIRNLYRWDKDCADAVRWLRANRDKFRMEVFEPPAISLTVQNGDFTNAIEACFSGNQLKTFVAQCEEDLDVLNHHINDSGALGRKARINTWYRPAMEHTLAAPPMSTEEMRGLGFNGYAIEYVDCPEGLKWYLRKELSLHRTAIALNASRVDTGRAMEAASKLFPDGSGGGASFIAGSTMNIVQRSRYGKRAAQNTTRDVRQARTLVADAVDPEAQKQAQTRIKEARHELQGFQSEAEGLSKESQKIADEGREQTKRVEALNRRKTAIREAQAKIHQTTSRLQQAREKRKTLLATPPAKERQATLKKSLLVTTKKRVKIVKEYTDIIRGAITDQVEATRSGLEYLQIGANRSALEQLCQQKDELYQEALAKFDEVDRRFKAVKNLSKEKLNASRAVLDGVDEELRSEYHAIEAIRQKWEKDCETLDPKPDPPENVEQRTTVQLEMDLQAKKTELEMNVHSNPGVVEQYERRKREIEELTNTLEDKTKKAERIEHTMKAARDNWEPALNHLVDSIGKKFSAAFDRIGCAGEIKISQDEDYDKWAIDILVKFRDKEKLQLLTGQRQSGGERSLTTILYLMSLTEEARAPFSLVDEINQGMDQRAERAVHNSMVEVTCKQNSAQYFLITPKLLPDLDYHERMKILCVNNGEWLPEEKGLGNMMGMVDDFLKHPARGPAAA